MKRAALALAAGVLGALGLWLWWSSPAPPVVAPTPDADPAARRALAQSMLAQVAERSPVAQQPRQEVTPPPSSDTTARVRVLLRDAQSGAGVASARVLDVHGGRELARTDASGEVTVPLLPPGRLAFFGDGYFIKLIQPGDDDATALEKGSAAATRVVVDLLRDDYTLPCVLRFVGPDATPPNVRFVIHGLDELPPSAGLFPDARLAPGTKPERELIQAWQRHLMLIQTMPAEQVDLCLGVLGAEQVFTAKGERPLRFVTAGNYRVEAIDSDAGLAGHAQFRVALGQAGPIEVRLTPGRFLRGVVLDASDQQPVAGVEVRLVTGGLALPPAQSDAAGRFALGPTALTSAKLQIDSKRHLPLEVQASVGGEQRFVLTRRPVRTVRGVVRRRPGLEPLPGAEVTIRRLGEVDARAETGADGGFALETVADLPELRVSAVGYLAWREGLHDPVDSYVCDLWPADAETRVRVGVTTLITGRVETADGKPVAGVPVQLFTDTPSYPEGLAGRAILEGHALPLRPLAITDDQGTYSLEWGHPGSARLLVTDGVNTPEQARPITLVLGQHLRDVVLRR